MNVELAAYGTRTRADDLWVQAGNDIVLFSLLEKQDEIDRRLFSLREDHLDRPVLEKMAFAQKLGIAGHEVESSISSRPLRSERGRTKLNLSPAFVIDHA